MLNQRLRWISVLGVAGLFLGAPRLGHAASPTAAIVDVTSRIPVISVTPTPVDSSQATPVVNIQVNEETDSIDMASLGLHPLPARAAGDLAPAPLGVSVGKGRAYLGLAPEVIDQNVSGAFVTLMANFIPGETIRYYLNGSLATSFAANSDGRAFVNVSTGAGYGYITVEALGVTSGRRAGGVVQVAPTGPYLPGLVAGPHAVNPNGSNTISLFGRGWAPSSTVNLYRNGVSLGTTMTNAGGRVTLTMTVAAGGDTSAVYAVDAGATGTMAGATVEERADAGTGDQNLARATWDRAVKNSTGLARFQFMAEGFLPGETVAISGCVTLVDTARADGWVGIDFGIGGGAGLLSCVVTGATSGRVARATLQANANATDIRGMIAVPTTVLPGSAGGVLVVANRVTPNDTGSFYLDGVKQGQVPTGTNGIAFFFITGAKTPFVHAIGYAGTGGADSEAVLLEVLPGPNGDVDRDRRTDRTVFRPGSGTFFSALSNGGATSTTWGVGTDVDVLGDYDADGKADVAVWRPSNGTWYIVQSSNGAVRAQIWGAAGDIPLVGDVDGDGQDDLTVSRPSTGEWFISKSGGGATYLVWGAGSDQPILADFDGDGKADPAVFRPSNGFWYVYLSGGGSMVIGWGMAGDIPVPGNFDGDGKADIAVFRPSTGQWFVYASSGGSIAATWGMTNDVPVRGDWDGDGKDDFTVWRPSTGSWYTLNSTGGTSFVSWGTNGDRPTGRQPGT